MQHISFLTHTNVSVMISLLDTNTHMQHSYTANSTLRIERNVNKAFWKIHMYFSMALWVAECIHALLTNTQ